MHSETMRPDDPWSDVFAVKSIRGIAVRFPDVPSPCHLGTQAVGCTRESRRMESKIIEVSVMKSFYSFLDQSPIDVEIICGEAHDRRIIAATLNCIVKARKNILQTAATAGNSPCFKSGPQFVVGGIIRDYDEDFQACIGGPLCAQDN